MKKKKRYKKTKAKKPNTPLNMYMQYASLLFLYNKP